MKLTKKQLKQIAKVEKKVANVCDANDGVVDELTGIAYPKKTTEVTLNDKGVIVNKENGKPHFQELIKKISSEKKSNNIEITISFGKSSPSLKEQIESQGFKISKEAIKGAEQIIFDLHSLNEVGILKEKDLFKCFNRLNKKICVKILDTQLKYGQKAILKNQIIEREY